MPSGFRKFHSTETHLLLRRTSDIYGAIDRAELTLLALFDVSAAFDTVDHINILLKRLNVTFGLSGSFLGVDRLFPPRTYFSVVYGSTRSRWAPAPYGLPQGSVLGPLLYIIYTSGLALLLAEHGAVGQLYADDTQAYMHCVSMCHPKLPLHSSYGSLGSDTNCARDMDGIKPSLPKPCYDKIHVAGNTAAAG